MPTWRRSTVRSATVFSSSASTMSVPSRTLATLPSLSRTSWRVGGGFRCGGERVGGPAAPPPPLAAAAGALGGGGPAGDNPADGLRPAPALRDARRGGIPHPLPFTNEAIGLRQRYEHDEREHA